jgi:hypothetical protein
MVGMETVICSLISLGVGIFIGWKIKKSSDNRGRLAHFKHGKKYMYNGHGIVDGKSILRCTKGYMVKTYYFEKPTSTNITKLISGTVYLYYRPEDATSAQLLTEPEYREMTK